MNISEEAKYNYGWAYIFFLIANILINTLWLWYETLKGLIHFIKSKLKALRGKEKVIEIDGS